MLNEKNQSNAINFYYLLLLFLAQPPLPTSIALFWTCWHSAPRILMAPLLPASPSSREPPSFHTRSLWEAFPDPLLLVSLLCPLYLLTDASVTWADFTGHSLFWSPVLCGCLCWSHISLHLHTCLDSRNPQRGWFEISKQSSFIPAVGHMASSNGDDGVWMFVPREKGGCLAWIPPWIWECLAQKPPMKRLGS